MNIVDKTAEQVNSELPGKSDEDGWRRLHPLSPVLQSGLTLLVIFSILIYNLRDFILAPLLKKVDPEFDSYPGDISADTVTTISKIPYWWLLILGVVFLILLLVAFVSWLSWLVTTYRVTEQQVQLRSGLLSKKQRRAPLNRIQSIDLERPLLARIFGLTAVKITTAGGAFALSYLAHKNAVTVRTEIARLSSVVKRQETANNKEESDPDAVAPEKMESGSATAQAAQGAQNASSAQSSGRAWSKSVVDNVLDTDLDQDALERNSIVKIPVARLVCSVLLSSQVLILTTAMLLSSGFSVLGIALSGEIHFGAVLFVLLPILFVIASVVFAALNKGWGFAVSEFDGEVRLRSGLTTTKSESVPLERINAVEIRQPLLWRIFGWYTVYFSSSGGTEASTGKLFEALPVGTKDDAIKVMQLVLRQSLPTAIAQHILTRNSQLEYRAENKAVPLCVLSAANEGAAILHHADDKQVFVVRGGLLALKISFARLEKAQAVQLTSGFAHSILGLRAVATVRPGMSNKTFVRGLNQQAAHELFARLNNIILAVLRDNKVADSKEDANDPIGQQTDNAQAIAKSINYAVSSCPGSESTVRAAGK